MPSCSFYTDEAVLKYGLWAGGWMGLGRICRCHPWGASGIDNVPEQLPEGSVWYKPWNYALWRMDDKSSYLTCEPCCKDAEDEDT